MRKLMLLVTVLGLAGSLSAADPIVGTWKVNPAKSKAPASAAANTKETIAVFREIDADTIEGTSTETRNDGSTVSAKWTVPKRGGNLTYQQGGPAQGISIIATIIDLNTTYNTYLQNGKQVGLMHVSISKDGKTFTTSWKGTDAQGKPYEYFVLYEKQ